MHRNAIDLTGRVFGRLTAIKRSEATPTSNDGHCMWDCICECSNEVCVSSHKLLSGITKSCGCLKRDRILETHKRWMTTEDKEIAIRFKVMKGRCYNPNNPKYPRWGGRGITICDEWLKDKRTFVEWSKTHGYAPGLSINRINNDGPYSPENCEWTNNLVQSNNRSNNVMFEIDGVKRSISEWAQLTEMDYEVLRRIYHRDPQKFMDKVVNNERFEEEFSLRTRCNS